MDQGKCALMVMAVSFAARR